ncbi:MAG: serpin family protein [Muribaculaceae bacterium]
MKAVLKFMALPMIALMCACSDDAPKAAAEPTPEPTPAPTPSSEQVTTLDKLVEINFTDEENSANEALNTFAFDMLGRVSANYDQIFQADKTGNLTLSPLSAATCLSLLANTCDQDNAAAIYRAIGYENVTTLNSVVNKLLRHIPCAELGAQVALANSVWFDRNSITPPSDYVALMNTTFGAEVNGMVPYTDDAVKLINDWCNLHTNGLIPVFLDEVPCEVVMLNALYFNGTWAHKFDKSLTTSESFYSPKGISVVDMMHKEIFTDYYADDNFEVLELPFDGENYSLRLLLPRQGVDIAAATEMLSYDYFRTILTGERRVDATLSMPRLNLDQELQLTSLLRTYGLNVDAVALPAIGAKNLGSINIKQKTASRIDEEGASMAAVTGNGWATSTGEEPKFEEVSITFNRPFIFVLTNTRTNTVLMAGRILHP